MSDSASALVRPAAPSRLLAWLHVGDRALFAAMLVLQLAPLALFRHFPTRDGPTHVEAAQILLRYHRPEEAALRQWFELVLPLAPNWLDHAVLAGLSLVLPPLAAEKLLVAAFVVGMPLAARRALAAVRPDAGFLAALTLPLTYTWLLHMGFYNFCLGLPLVFLAVASVLNDRVASTDALLRLTGWATLLYFTHAVALLAAAALAVGFAAWSGVVDAAEARRLGLSVRYVCRQACRRIGRTALAFAPAALLFAAWVGGRRPRVLERLPQGELLRDLARLDVLVSFSRAEAWPAAAVALVFLVLSASALRSRLASRGIREGDAWLLCAAGFVAAYLLAPSGLAGGSYLSPRLALLPLLPLLLWLGSMRWSAPTRTVVAAAAAAVSIAFHALHARTYREANDRLAEYLSAEPWLEAGTAVLPLHYRGEAEGEPPRIDVLAHAAAHFAISRHTIDLVFYEGTGRGVFPIAYHREVNPYRLLGEHPEAVPPCVDLERFMERTGRPIDTVLTWQRPPDPGPDCAVRTLEQLQRRYERVYASRPRHLMEVWRLRAER